MDFPLPATDGLDRNRAVAEMRRAGADCTTMSEVREAVDSLDRELVGLLAERFRLMDAAARIKSSRDAVRDEPRKQQVIDNASAEAKAQGIDSDLVEKIWEMLVEASISHELIRWDTIRAVR